MIIPIIIIQGITIEGDNMAHHVYHKHVDEKTKPAQRQETHIHLGTQPMTVSHHSGNKVSNPNIVHHHAVHERHAGSHKTYIHHQKGKTHNILTHNPNTLPVSPTTSNPTGSTSVKPTGIPQKPVVPPKGPVQPVTKPIRPTAPGRVSPQPVIPPKTTTTVKPSPHTTSAGPLHPGINFGVTGTTAWDPNVDNRPGEGSATGISAVNKNGKVPVTSTNTYDPQYDNSGAYNGINNAINTVKQWVQNGTTTKKETPQQLANDPTYQVGQWENNTLINIGKATQSILQSIGIQPT